MTYFENLGAVEYDGLISGITPEPKTTGGTIRKLSAAATLKRGTILAKSSGSAGGSEAPAPAKTGKAYPNCNDDGSINLDTIAHYDGKLVILGSTAASNETLTPDCILADDIDVGTAADVNAAVYDMGCFDPAKLTVKTGYTLTTGDKDTLREKGIYLVAKNA